MKYLDDNGIKAVFKNYLTNSGYSKAMAERESENFPDIYDCEYLRNEFVGYEDVDGVKYEKRTVYTDFSCMGEMIRPFLFYMLFNVEDVEDGSVLEYMAAQKLYQCEDLNLDDFPDWVTSQLN